MPPPTIIEPIIQKNVGDCAIAVLAMLLGKPYREVSAAAITMTRTPHRVGLGSRQIAALARAMGSGLTKARPPFDLEDETGMLCVAFPDKSEHAMVLFCGVIYNPADGLLYAPDVYLSAKRTRVVGLWRVR